MRKFIILFVLISIVISAQKSTRFPGEIRIRIINIPDELGNVTVSFKATRIFDTKWYPQRPTETHGILVSDTEYDEVITSIEIDEYDPDNRYYVYYDTEGDDAPGIGLAVTKYKIRRIGGEASFKLYTIHCGGWYDTDLTYDFDNDKFYYEHCGPDPDDCTELMYSYTTVYPYTGSGITSCLELYLSLSNQNNHPYLSWNEYRNSRIIGYYLYRKIQPKVGNSNTIKIALSSSTTSYLDSEITYGSSWDAMVTYWVRAIIKPTIESVKGNSVGTKGEFTPEKAVVDNFAKEELIKFNLSPNYPNPFNPTTKITYQIPQKGQVVLKIYNTLGKEVAELVNETKEKGIYSVTFNAENLPSGMYFYKISVSDPSTSSGQGFTDVKKMLLLK